MSGFLSELGSGISGAASSLEQQANNFLGGLNPQSNQTGVVKPTDMSQYPVSYSSENPGAFFNANYAVFLHGQDETGRTIEIVASLPEHFSFHLSSDWQPLLNNPSIAALIAGGTSGFLKDGALLAAGIGKAAGFTDYSQAATQLVWNGTTPIDFALPMVFNACSNPTTDVMQPIRDLCMLVVPSAEDYVLKMPGPNILGLVENNGYKITMCIGNALVIENVIITGVSPVFDVMCDENGNFISAQVDVSVRTATILTKQDIINMFGALVPAPSGSSALPAQFSGNLSSQQSTVQE